MNPFLIKILHKEFSHRQCFFQEGQVQKDILKHCWTNQARHCNLYRSSSETRPIIFEITSLSIDKVSPDWCFVVFERPKEWHICHPENSSSKLPHLHLCTYMIPNSSHSANKIIWGLDFLFCCLFLKFLKNVHFFPSLSESQFQNLSSVCQNHYWFIFFSCSGFLVLVWSNHFTFSFQQTVLFMKK